VEPIQLGIAIDERRLPIQAKSNAYEKSCVHCSLDGHLFGDGCRRVEICVVLADAQRYRGSVSPGLG